MEDLTTIGISLGTLAGTFVSVLTAVKMIWLDSRDRRIDDLERAVALAVEKRQAESVEVATLKARLEAESDKLDKLGETMSNVARETGAMSIAMGRVQSSLEMLLRRSTPPGGNPRAG